MTVDNSIQTTKKERIIYDVLKFKFPGIANLEVTINNSGRGIITFDKGRYTHNQVDSFVTEFLELCKKK